MVCFHVILLPYHSSGCGSTGYNDTLLCYSVSYTHQGKQCFLHSFLLIELRYTIDTTKGQHATRKIRTMGLFIIPWFVLLVLACCLLLLNRIVVLQHANTKSTNHGIMNNPIVRILRVACWHYSYSIVDQVPFKVLAYSTSISILCETIRWWSCTIGASIATDEDSYACTYY